MAPNEKLIKLAAPEDGINVKTYQSMLGSLMYLMLGTRPYLAFAVGALSQHAATPGSAHLAALKRVYHYVRGTSDYALVYNRSTNGLALTGYVDADWAADVNTRRSVTGYVFTLAGGAVSWASRKQHSTALSSTEAEYMAASQATTEAIWLRNLRRELKQLEAPYSGPLLIDNQSAIALIKNAEFHERTKHIAVRYHFIRERYESGEIAIEYCPTGDQVADVLTKGLSREKVERFSEKMGLTTHAH